MAHVNKIFCVYTRIIKQTVEWDSTCSTQADNKTTTIIVHFPSFNNEILGVGKTYNTNLPHTKNS